MSHVFKDIRSLRLTPARAALNRLTASMLAKASGQVIGFGVVLGLSALAPAHAALIQNGGFETGNFASWTVSGNVAIAGVPFFGEGSNAADGNFFTTFNSGNSAPNGVLSQTFATVPGTQYALTYLYGSNGGARQSITTSVQDAQGTNLATQFVTLPAASGNLAPFSLAFTADAASSTLSFTDYAGNPTVSTDGFVDNVSVAAVPEPSSLVLLAVAFLGASVIGSVRTRATRSVSSKPGLV